MQHYDQRGTDQLLLLQQQLGNLHFQQSHYRTQRSSKTKAKYIDSTTESRKLLCSTLKNFHLTKLFSKVVNMQGFFILKADGIIFHKTGKPYFIYLLLSPKKGIEFSSPPTTILNIHSFISYVERLRVEFSQHGEEATFPGAGDPSMLLSCITEQTGENHRM